MRPACVWQCFCRRRYTVFQASVPIHNGLTSTLSYASKLQNTRQRSEQHFANAPAYGSPTAITHDLGIRQKDQRTHVPTLHSDPRILRASPGENTKQTNGQGGRYPRWQPVDRHRGFPILCLAPGRAPRGGEPAGAGGVRCRPVPEGRTAAPATRGHEPGARLGCGRQLRRRWLR